MVKPITPQEAMEQTGSHIPDFFLAAINRLITVNIQGDESVTLKQEDIINEILHRNGCCRQDIFHYRWLEFESVYEKAGWEVLYDKPGYCESYDQLSHSQKNLDKYNF